MIKRMEREGVVVNRRHRALVEPGSFVDVPFPSFSGIGNGCDNGQISCFPLDNGGLMVVAMAIYRTFIFGGREVVVVTPSSSGVGNGCGHGQIPCSPTGNKVW